MTSKLGKFPPVLRSCGIVSHDTWPLNAAHNSVYLDKLFIACNAFCVLHVLNNRRSSVNWKLEIGPLCSVVFTNLVELIEESI